jgi:hypothetical protein
MFGLFNTTSTETLFGSTAEVALYGNKVVKNYFDHVSQTRRRIELENLEELGCKLGRSKVRVPDLLSVKYKGDDIISLTLTRVDGVTLRELRQEGLYDLAEEAYSLAFERVGYLVTDLETDGNIRVEVSSNRILRVWVVDVGDSF